ncbi:unnamed protein product [Acidithrix sp. C25]|nr:unnamed protein product [Acidithrix sp. C25]
MVVLNHLHLDNASWYNRHAMAPYDVLIAISFAIFDYLVAKARLEASRNS